MCVICKMAQDKQRENINKYKKQLEVYRIFVETSEKMCRDCRQPYVF